MATPFEPSEPQPAESLENRMRKASLLISLAGLGLMAVGLIAMLCSGDTFALPGFAVVSLENLILLHPAPLGLTLASAGILLLGLLPAVRVLMAAWLALRSHNLLGTLVATVVLVELLVSIRIGK
jgi:hypothetical protein